MERPWPNKDTKSKFSKENYLAISITITIVERLEIVAFPRVCGRKGISKLPIFIIAAHATGVNKYTVVGVIINCTAIIHL